jgi:hypothetical protein
MPKTILNSVDSLSGPSARATAQQLADRFGCHWSRVYEATKHLRPKRKVRADKGKRRADLREHSGMNMATSLVVGYNLDPDLALETARANGHETPVSLGTYRRQLREAGLNRGQRRSRRVVHRRFEAEAPGEIFQFDISGVKNRMVDVRNRRIIQVHAGDVNENHPNKKSTRVGLWKFTIKDDHSRKMFTKFVAAVKPNSCHVIDFELEAFRELGVPLTLYSDNDAVIVSRLNKRAGAILDRAFAESGGFKLEQHLPYNSNATGKVENSHLLVEKFEKLIAIGELPTLDELNLFAARVCERYNWTEHRETGEKPEIRFRAGHGVMRVPPDALLNDAFKAREFDVKVNSDVTISVDAVKWQLPRGPRVSSSLKGAKEVDNPFVDLAQTGKTVQVVWPIEANWFLAVTSANEFEIPKIEAVADAADEHKSVAESTALQNTKYFKAVADAGRAAVKSGEASPIVRPGIDVDFEIAAEERPAMMPRKRVEASLEQWASIASAVPASAIGEQLLDYWSAATLLQEEESLSNPLNNSDQSWLKSVFAGRNEIVESELRAAVAARVIEPAQVVEMRTA